MTRRSPSPLRLLQLTGFVATLDRFVMPPMLVAIALDLGVPLSDVVHAAGAYFLVYGLSQPLWGAVSDRFGRVPTMRTTLLLAGIFGLASAAAWSPLALGVARGLTGGFFGAAYPSSLIYLGDTVPASRRQRDIARLMVGVALGTAAASVGAGALVDVASWRVAFVEGAVLLGALTLLPPAVEDAGASATVAGLVTAVYGVAVLGASALVGRLASRWHPSRLIALGASAAVLACGLLAVSQEPPMAVVVAALLGLAWTSMHSSLQTWATEVLPGSRATVVSFFAGSLFVGSAIGAVVVAGLADAGRYAAIYAAYAVLAVPLGIAATWGRSRWHRPPDAVPDSASLTCNRVQDEP